MVKVKRFSIEGFNKYSFGLDGSVYHIRKGKFLVGSLNGDYLQFGLYNDDNILKSIPQQKIVYKLFNIDYQLFQGNKLVVGHLNSNGLDNHISNLKLMTHRENLSIERTQKSGLPVGVSLHDGRFLSRIWINGSSNSLGLYDTPEEAHQAYLDAKKIYHII